MFNNAAYFGWAVEKIFSIRCAQMAQNSLFLNFLFSMTAIFSFASRN